jgi:hypothetical protein
MVFFNCLHKQLKQPLLECRRFLVSAVSGHGILHLMILVKQYIPNARLRLIFISFFNEVTTKENMYGYFAGHCQVKAAK